MALAPCAMSTLDQPASTFKPNYVHHGSVQKYQHERHAEKVHANIRQESVRFSFYSCGELRSA